MFWFFSGLGFYGAAIAIADKRISVAMLGAWVVSLFLQERGGDLMRSLRPHEHGLHGGPNRDGWVGLALVLLIVMAIALIFLVGE